MDGMTTIHGEVAAGFEPVREAFAANFAQHGRSDRFLEPVGRESRYPFCRRCSRSGRRLEREERSRDRRQSIEQRDELYEPIGPIVSPDGDSVMGLSHQVGMTALQHRLAPVPLCEGIVDVTGLAVRNRGDQQAEGLALRMARPIVEDATS
jgi:hypothetical protein